MWDVEAICVAHNDGVKSNIVLINFINLGICKKADHNKVTLIWKKALLILKVSGVRLKRDLLTFGVSLMGILSYQRGRYLDNVLHSM